VLDKVLSRPHGTTQTPQEGPVPRGNEVLLTGHQLTGDGDMVRIGDVDVTPQSTRDDVVVFRFPETRPEQELPPGIYPVSVVQDLSFPDGTSRKAFESNAVAVVRQPSVVEPVQVAGTVVTVQLDLPVRDDQRVVLLLDELDPPGDRNAASYQFPAPVPLGSRADDHSITVTTSGVLAAVYLVRVQVDGVRSRTGDDLRTPTVRMGA
jgi:hypothetical protein